VLVCHREPKAKQSVFLDEGNKLIADSFYEIALPVVSTSPQ
jgi:hypothetical protein